MNPREKLLSHAIRSMHEAACQRGEEFYIDPESGRIVFTRVKHLARGACCGSGCRHCPYDSIACDSEGASVRGETAAEEEAVKTGDVSRIAIVKRDG